MNIPIIYMPRHNFINRMAYESYVSKQNLGKDSIKLKKYKKGDVKKEVTKIVKRYDE